MNYPQFSGKQPIVLVGWHLPQNGTATIITACTCKCPPSLTLSLTGNGHILEQIQLIILLFCVLL